MILGTIGAARAGKGEFAMVAEGWEYGFITVEFSEAVKREVEVRIGIPYEEQLRNPAKYRKIQQDYAQSIRDVKPFYWVEKVAEKVKALQTEGQERILINGIRFPEDYAVIQNMGATFIKIERPGKERIKAGMDPERMKDISERFIDIFLYDYLIRNDRNLRQYHRRAARLLDHLLDVDGIVFQTP